MPHVEELQELALAVLPGGIVALGDLPPAGDSRLAGEELVACVAKLVGLVLGHGTRANHGEVAGQHVEELRDLVERRLAQEVAHTRDARVVVELLLAVPDLELLRSQILLGVVVGVRHHRAELEDPDGLAVLAHALLTEDGAAGRVGANHGAQDGSGDQADQAHDA